MVHDAIGSGPDFAVGTKCPYNRIQPWAIAYSLLKAETQNLSFKVDSDYSMSGCSQVAAPSGQTDVMEGGHWQAAQFQPPRPVINE